MLAAWSALFAFLLTRRQARTDPGARRATTIVVASLASINFSGAVGLAWWAATIVIYDGMMVEELMISTGLIALLGVITGGALALDRRGMVKTALSLLTVAALPTIAIFGFLLYLDSHPIAWR